MEPRFYGTGYRPSPPEKVGLGHPQRLSAAYVPERSYVELPAAVNQGRSSSCTGNSSAVAICAAMARALRLPPGQFPELPSRLFLYFGARAEIGETNRDEGAFIHSIFDTARKLGVPPESAWPFSDKLGNIVKQPDWTALQAAADQKIVEGAYRISTPGALRADDVARALGEGAAVVWGTATDNTLYDVGPDDVWEGVKGTPTGGHAMVLHAHEPWRDGKRKFLSRSSWGPEYGRDGSVWVSEDVITSPDSSDFWIVEMSPFYSSLQEAP